MSYQNRRVLAPIDLPFFDRQITAIIGPSGCGKSSCLQAINRISDLIPGCRIGGTVQLDNELISGPNVDVVAIRRRIGMIFQRPNPFPLSIRQNLTLPLREHGMTKRADLDATVRRVLEDVGLWPEVHNRLHTAAQKLSGGQQQRLCIARALTLRPDVLLFDEPCSALDPLASQTVEDLIRKLREHATIVIVTHNLAQARRLADHVAMFWHESGEGRLIESGPANQIFDQPTHSVTRAYVQGTTG